MPVSVVLPTYNEKKNIEILIPKLEGFFKKQGIEAEIIVVDDSSPDGSAEAAKKLNKKYRNIMVFIKNKKEGIGAALRVGYSNAKKDVIISLDSDLSFEIQDIKKLLNKLDAGYDLVVGSRHSKGGAYLKPTFAIKLKGAISRVGNIFVKFLIGIPINDFSANFRAIRKDVWLKLETKEKTNALLLEMIVAAYYNGCKVAEVPVTFKDRVYGESKLNLAKEAPKFLLKLISLAIKYRIFKKITKEQIF